MAILLWLRMLLLGLVFSGVVYAGEVPIGLYYPAFKREIDTRERLISNVTIPDSVLKLHAMLCAQTKICPELVVSTKVVGMLSSSTKVLMNPSYLSLPEGQLYAAMAHEFGHVKVKDVQYYLEWLSYAALTRPNSVEALAEFSAVTAQHEEAADMYALEQLAGSAYDIGSLEALLVSLSKGSSSKSSIWYKSWADRINAVRLWRIRHAN